MPYKLTTIDAIKSASQRELACHWDRLCAGRPMPAVSDFCLPAGLKDPTRLVVWDVEGTGRLVKFRAAYQGAEIARIFPSPWPGRTMDEVIPISLRRTVMEAAKECIASSCLTYTILSTIDISGRQIDCERLLLPFGSGSKVEQILASLELTQVPGGVRMTKILASFEIDARLNFAGRIASGFTAAKSPAAEADNPPGPTSSNGELRRTKRRVVRRAGRIRFGDKVRTCMIRNVSATGALIEDTNVADIPESFALTFEMESAERRCIVAWRKKTRLGVRFSPAANRSTGN